MEEKTIWKGNPSQWINFGAFVSCIFVITIPFVIWKWLKTKHWLFEITNEQIIETTGVFTKTINELELYLVKDLQLEQPFLLRFMKLSNIKMNTSDKSHPIFLIPAIPNGNEIKEQLRTAIEERRDLKGVKETDFE
jgi:uncharacterized membrane protein YdbT with pleckstrin-like domain